MPKVNERLQKLLGHKDEKTGLFAVDVKKVLEETRRQVEEEIRAVSDDTYQAHSLRNNLSAIERQIQTFESAAKRKIREGQNQLWADGEQLVEGSLGGRVGVIGEISPKMLTSLNTFADHLVGRLASDAVVKVRGELTLGVLGAKSPAQIAAAIAGTLKSKGVFDSIAERAEVITRTELGRAYSVATHETIVKAAPHVPGLMKEWWHAGHPKYPRRSHLALSGQRVDADKPFIYGSVILMHPRDPKAPASEVVRCGCDLLPWKEEWDK